MTFAGLYNPDNGIIHSYDELVAKNRTDLVAVTAEEMKSVRAVGVDAILAKRRALAAPTASVSVETKDEPTEAEMSPEPVSVTPAAKGVSVVGKVKKDKQPTDDIQFEDARRDYKKYSIYSGDIFPVDDLQSVPDDDLTRFAKEVLNRKYDDVSAFATDDERTAFYAALRAKIEKALSRINKKRIAKRAEREAAKNGGND